MDTDIRIASASVAQLRGELYRFMERVEAIPSPEAVQATLKEEENLDIERYLRQAWEESLNDSASLRTRERNEKTLKKLDSWIRSLGAQGEKAHEGAIRFLEQCRSVPLLAEKLSELQESEVLVLQRIERFIGGFCDVVTGEISEELRGQDQVRFVIDWSGTSSVGHWVGPTETPSLPLRDIAADSAETMGEMQGDLVELIADEFLSRLRQGDIALPVFRRDRSSTRQSTILHWLRPVSKRSRSTQSAERTEPVKQLPVDNPDEMAIAFEQRFPEVAMLLDQVTCLTVRKEAASRQRPVCAEAGSGIAVTQFPSDGWGLILRSLVQVVQRCLGVSDAMAEAIVGISLKRNEGEDGLAKLRGILEQLSRSESA